jgi:hypothetical protein
MQHRISFLYTCPRCEQRLENFSNRTSESIGLPDWIGLPCSDECSGSNWNWIDDNWAWIDLTDGKLTERLKREQENNDSKFLQACQEVTAEAESIRRNKDASL